MSDMVRVRYVDGRAEVSIGNRALHVERRDSDGRSDTCPIELVSSALGS